MKNIIKVFTPIYLLRSFENCWKCGANQAVIAIATKHLEESDSDEPDEGDDAAILQDIRAMPPAIRDYLVQRHPPFEVRTSKTKNFSYYMNTCTCGAHFGDFYLYSEPGGAFFPMSEEEAAQITVEEMPFTGKFDFECSFGVGLGDFILEHGKKLNQA